MKRSTFLPLLIASGLMLFSVSTLRADDLTPVPQGPRFVDLNGDGVCDSGTPFNGQFAPGLDPNWTPPENGDGMHYGWAHRGEGQANGARYRFQMRNDANAPEVPGQGFMIRNRLRSQERSGGPGMGSDNGSGFGHMGRNGGGRP